MSAAVADAATIDAFRQDGAVVLRGAFTDWIEPLRDGVAQLMADPGPMERTVVPEDGSAPFFQDLCNWQRIAPFRDFVETSPAAAIAARLMGSTSARFFHDHVLVKPAGNSTITPWHQDAPYYCVSGAMTVSLWIPLDAVEAGVAMRCVLGSHRWQRLFRPMRFNGTRLYARDDFEPMPDIDAMGESVSISDWALAPGDAIAFDFRTVHGAPANRSAHPRRVFSARWVGDDAIYVDRGEAGSPPFTGLGLRDGQPLDGPLFPVVYRVGPT